MLTLFRRCDCLNQFLLLGRTALQRPSAADLYRFSSIHRPHDLISFQKLLQASFLWLCQLTHVDLVPVVQKFVEEGHCMIRLPNLEIRSRTHNLSAPTARRRHKNSLWVGDVLDFAFQATLYRPDP